MSERYADPARRSLDIARAWRAAAVADGWTIAPVYQGGDVENASKHTRGNLKASVYTQPGTNSGSVSVWGIADGAAVDVPDVYDWAALQANLRRCSECGAEDVECGRVHVRDARVSRMQASGAGEVRDARVGGMMDAPKNPRWYTVPAGTEESECPRAGCGAPVFWIKTANDRNMPVDCDVDGAERPSPKIDPRQLDVFAGALGTEQEHDGHGPCHFDVCAGERTPR